MSPPQHLPWLRKTLFIREYDSDRIEVVGLRHAEPPGIVAQMDRHHVADMGRNEFPRSIAAPPSTAASTKVAREAASPTSCPATLAFTSAQKLVTPYPWGLSSGSCNTLIQFADKAGNDKAAMNGQIGSACPIAQLSNQPNRRRWLHSGQTL